MHRSASIHRYLFASLPLTFTALAWWGCAKGNETTTTTTDTNQSTSSGNGGSGGVELDASGSADHDADACVAKNEEAHRVKLDLVFLVDRSQSMSGAKWEGTTKALAAFFNDQASAGVSAGIVYVPTAIGCECEHTSYQVLDVPIDALPDHAFALTNSMPADATGACTPSFGGLKGALMAATAYQDEHPTHKVALVYATDGEAWTPFGCDPVGIEAVASLASSALAYNGVRTYVIGVDGSINQNLDLIAIKGGTEAAYDVTLDIDQFAATIAEIRSVALGCDFDLPPPPDDMDLDPNQVNFSYTPMGIGDPKILPRADDLADCDGGPGWYYDNNAAPTKIILCPASCATVQADGNAKVEVLFGCSSIAN